ncbi:hypothetical protein BDW67DRAFT_185508 [Aspergillus spinulosporus]
MSKPSEFQSQSKRLSAAIDSLVAEYPMISPESIAPEPPVDQQARESVLTTAARAQAQLAGPSEFVQQLVRQTQTLACVHWLGEFQVPAFIPLEGTAMVQDLSDLIGIPESQLSRVIRMAVTAGFLQEPHPGHVAHSALSAAFIQNPSYLDAVMFLAETVMPAALGMPGAAQQGAAASAGPGLDAVPLNSNGSNACPKSDMPRLQRRWHAYLRHGTGYVCDTVTDILTCLEPLQSSNASVVEVGARSTERAIALANQYPTLRFTVQLQQTCDSSSTRNGDQSRTLRKAPGVIVQQRVLGSPQLMHDASVYILNLPLPMPGMISSSLATHTRAELRAHLPIVRQNRSAKIVLLVPSPIGEPSESSEAMSLMRIRNLSFWQLANDRELDVSEVVGLVGDISDNEGRLVVVNRVRSSAAHGTVALEVKFQAYKE